MIKIKRIEIRQIFIPFRFKYGHNLATHNGVSSIICKVVNSDNSVGYGEAVPREYVTGENCESVILSIKEISKPFLNQEISISQFKEIILSMAYSENKCFPSCAFCAFEGAVLDLFGHMEKLPIASLFSDKGKNPLTYSGSIGIGNIFKSTLKAIVYRNMGFNHFKIKVGDNNDIQRIKQIKKLFPEQTSFFADANCSWNKEEAIYKIEAMYKLGIQAIEEPLEVISADKICNNQINRESILNIKHYEKYQWLKERSPIPIIADESLISMTSLNRIINSNSFDILNIRLSKCGGFILASEMVKIANENKIYFAIGAMVAESPILANEGAHFGYVHSTHKYIQGYSHKALHKNYFASGGSDLKKGASVLLDLNTVGNGLTIDSEKLNKLTIKKEIIL